MSAKPRQRNNGIRKMCKCARRSWKDCEDPWHFNLTYRGTPWRFSLDRHVGRHIRTKAEALKIAEDIRTKIRDGKFGTRTPDRETLTISNLLGEYERRKLAIRDGGPTIKDVSQIGVLKRTALVTAKGESRPFGDWLVADVTPDALLQYREQRQGKTMASNGDGKSQPRRTGGPIAVNRNLAPCFALRSTGRLSRGSSSTRRSSGAPRQS